tara:strand:- start:2967 stop:4025 length:1059 start_codon:yes stop_codon:yes gene_type:complete
MMIESLFGDSRKELFIRPETFSTFSDTEKENHIEKVFQFYRKNGFPYFPTHRPYRIKKLSQALACRIDEQIDRDNKTIRQSMNGLAFCWSYHPQAFGVKCNTMRTPIEVFESDELFRRLLWKCGSEKMGQGWHDSQLRLTCSIFSGTQRVSNFRPSAAAAIYKIFCHKGDSVYDMSSGYGGRCLGAHMAKMKYFGVDPCTQNFNGVQSMISEFGFDAKIKNIGSEIGGWLNENQIDFSFTSPPYFNCEKYSDEPTQSFLKYPSRELWLTGFIRKTLQECQRVTKPNRFIALNVANVQSYKTMVEDIIELANSLGMILDDVWKLNLTKLMKSKSEKTKSGFKSEPILIFKNVK